jgi:hypothetical protein
MKRVPACLLMTVLACLAGPGCSRPIVEADNPARLSAEDYRAHFDASIAVLRDNGYVIDRRDYRFGRISTRPQGSPNILEVWNPQNTTADQALESTFASERRRVNVTFAGVESPVTADAFDAYTFEVEVVLERRQIPIRRMAGSARRNVFTNLAAPPRELAERGITGNYWEPVGRDPYLEARLIQQITQQVRTGGSSATDEHG